MTKPKISNLVLILFLCICTNSHSQFFKSPFEIINTESGLSQNSVHSICQDSRGFMWFGTHDGLNRYDGFDFTLLKYMPDSENSLPSSAILTLLSDNDKFIWAGTENGLAKINIFTLEIKSFLPKNYKNKLFTINTLELSKKNNLLVGTNSGLYKFDTNTENFKIIPLINQNEIPKPISSLSTDKNGNLLIGTFGYGLYIKRYNTNKCQQLNLIRKKTVYLEDFYIYEMYKTNNNMVFISTNRSCFTYDPNTEKISPHEKLSKLFYKNTALTIVGGGNTLLLGLYQKDLIQFNLENNEIKTLSKYAPETDFFSTNYILTLFKDKSEIIWVGTDGGGVLKLSPRKISFAPYTIEKKGICVMSIEEISNNILMVGSYGKGLYKINLEKGVLSKFTDKSPDTLKISGNIVLALLKDSKNKLWIGTMNNGVSVYDLTSKKMKYYKYKHYDYNTVGSNMITCFFEDSNNNIWIGTGDGISLYLRNKKTFRHLYASDIDKSTLSANIINFITEAKNGDILVGTSGGGLNILNKSGKVKKIYKHNKNDKNSLGYNYINCIFEDDNETLWISTSGIGFDKLEKDTEIFKHFTETNGLPNNNVFVILQDNEKNLWMSTNKGIAKFNPFKETFKNFDYKDGLQGNEFNGNAGLLLSSQKMVFGGIKGMNVFYPSKIKPRKQLPVTIINKVKLFNKLLSKYNINSNWRLTKKLNLTYKQNTLSFDFVYLDYNSPEKNKYKYILEGLDNEPTKTTAKNRSVTYASLPPGQYVFRVWGANSDNKWDKKGDFITINITPPFWGTLTFKIISILFFIVFSNLLYFAWKKLYISYQYWRSSHIIGKRYKITEKIGSGGTGIVYKAIDKTTSKIVALKILDEKYLDPESIKRFSVEQTVYEKIKHRNTVEIFSKGEHNGQLYYVMEYVEGETLSSFVKNKQLNENQILCIFHSILDIIYEIHVQGVIHRDLKPDNIMICNTLQLSQIPTSCSSLKSKEVLRDYLKILDFGLAKILGGKTLTQSAIFGGTLYYFPPEFLFGRKVRETAFDYYSLGVVLYEMLTGSHLYNVSDSSELLVAVVNSNPEPPIAKNSHISPKVSDFVMKLIAKNPNNRLSDYDSIKKELSILLKKN